MYFSIVVIKYFDKATKGRKGRSTLAPRLRVQLSCHIHYQEAESEECTKLISSFSPFVQSKIPAKRW